MLRYLSSRSTPTLSFKQADDIIVRQRQLTQPDNTFRLKVQGRLTESNEANRQLNTRRNKEKRDTTVLMNGLPSHGEDEQILHGPQSDE
ncbi:hypothetical protein E1301_Tti004385 [Triplophysa tibetana]|uniref:Uncharacterized protein n=1 Tax=Triplophysa tibetana TaxID=1572043 RepID=A0A5A9N8G6_9TELE|nr:hypothetical protein E1301_Tti004385 [Triplophysa tibetana]